MGTMETPKGAARFNRSVPNPMGGIFPVWPPPLGIVEHVGRRSGKPYRTPVTVFSAAVDGKPGVAIVLTYGPDRHWLKNLTAAGGGRMRRNGKSFGVIDPKVVTTAEAAAHVTRGARPIL